MDTGWLIVQDVEYQGVTMRRDEMVMVPVVLPSLEYRLYDRRMEIDFDWPETPHNTFGNGPNKCVGSPLARAEMHVFL